MFIRSVGTASKAGRVRPIGTCSNAFVSLQLRRAEADYDPSSQFTAEDALTLIASAGDAIAAFDAGPIEAQRAFVLFLGLRPKNR